MKTAEEWVKEGNVAYSAKRYDEAIEYFNRAISLNPCCAETYYSLGHAYRFSKEDYDKTIKCYRLAIFFNSNYAEAYYSLGEFYGTLGKVKTEKNYLKKAAKLGSKPAQQWLQSKKILWE